MSVIDETWTVQIGKSETGAGTADVVTDGPGSVVGPVYGHSWEVTLGRAKLAAQAPAMARLLTRLRESIRGIEQADNFVLFSQDDKGRNWPASELINKLLRDADALA